MRRRSSILLVALLAMMLMCSTALADTGVNLQNVIVGDQNIGLITKTDDSRYLQPADFQVSFDVTSVVAQSVGAFERSGYATTHMYIVDVSTTSKNSVNRSTDIQNTLNQLIDSIPAGDQAAIVTTGMKASGISPTDDKGVLHATVESIQFDKTLNDLDRTIREVCQYIAQDSDANARTSIVILSSGENETLNTAVLSELGELIIQSRATVYTIAYKRKKSNESALSGYGLLARKSKGGLVLEAEYVSNGKAMDAADIAQITDEISENEKLFCLVNVPLTPSMSPFSSVSLKFVSGSQTYSDHYVLTENQLAQVKHVLDTLAPEPTQALTSTTTPTPEPGIWETAIQYAQDNVVIVVCGAVIAVLVVVLLVVLFKRRETSQEVSPQSEGGEITRIEPPKPPITEPVSDIAVQLTPLSHGDIVVHNVPAELTDTIQIGRQDDQCQIVIGHSVSDKDIREVSRVHAKLTRYGDSILIENLSQNGTKVNQTKITRPMVLQQNDVITLGVVSFRISWFKE